MDETQCDVEIARDSMKVALFESSEVLDQAS